MLKAILISYSSKITLANLHVATGSKPSKDKSNNTGLCTNNCIFIRFTRKCNYKLIYLIWLLWYKKDKEAKAWKWNEKVKITRTVPNQCRTEKTQS